MTAKKPSTNPAFDEDDAPDLSSREWQEKFAKARVRRGRPPLEDPKVSTTIRLSRDVIERFKADGPGWQTRIDEALREWIRKHDAA
jgi:uncharacterized protein (DUF4415 family)